MVPTASANAHDGRANKIAVHVDERPGVAIVSVSNDGEPINLSDAQLVFDPWYTTRPGHAGLGLWIVNDQLSRVGGYASLTNLAPPTFELGLPIVA